MSRIINDIKLLEKAVDEHKLKTKVGTLEMVAMLLSGVLAYL